MSGVPEKSWASCALCRTVNPMSPEGSGYMHSICKILVRLSSPRLGQQKNPREKTAPGKGFSWHLNRLLPQACVTRKLVLFFQKYGQLV